ncbi:hypothetical protein [Streptomyces shenzhenensis]|uniref:hypothetical protein n=1 Tax=Streptomyces shenzhenensis TaxID=943815 RepID=UPI00369C2C3F
MKWHPAGPADGTGPAVSPLIDAARHVLRELAIDPLALEADSGSARILALMDETALRRRSRGPYSPDNLPPEAMETVDWVVLRMYSNQERPRFTVEGGGPWPSLLVRFDHSRVVVRYIVPEAAPPVYVYDAGDLRTAGGIPLALEALATSLRAAGARLGGEPPLTVSLSYPDDPAYEANVARFPEHLRDAVPPVVPTLDIDRSGCSAGQRAAHDKALRAGTFGKGFERLGRRGFTMTVGGVRLRDHNG